MRDKKSWIFKIVIAAAIVILLLVIAEIYEKRILRNAMERYLEDTYKMNFVVSRPKFGFNMVDGFNINAICTTVKNGVEVKNEIMFLGFDEEFPFQSSIITADIWSNSALVNYNNLVKQIYGNNALLTDWYSFTLDFKDEELVFGDDYGSSIRRYKDYLDKDYKYILKLAKEGKERIAIRITYVVIVNQAINMEEEMDKIKKLRSRVQSYFNPEDFVMGIKFVTKKYNLQTYKFKDIELSEDIPSEYGTEGQKLIKEGKLIGYVFLFAEESNKFFDKHIKEEFQRITRVNRFK